MTLNILVAINKKLECKNRTFSYDNNLFQLLFAFLFHGEVMIKINVHAEILWF